MANGISKHNKQITRQQSSPPQISSETLEKIVEQQTEQVKLNQQELAIQQQSESNKFEFAKLALQAQKEDLTDHRKHQDKQTTKVCIIVAIIIFALSGFLGGALYAGKDQIVKDFLQIVGGIIGGGIGGYGLGKSSSKKEKETDSGS